MTDEGKAFFRDLNNLLCILESKYHMVLLKHTQFLCIKHIS